MRRPCQWTSSGVSVWLTTSTVMGLPSRMRRMGPGEGAVVADGGEDALGGEFYGDGGDGEGEVGGLAGGGWGGRHGHLRTEEPGGVAARAREPVLMKSRRCMVSPEAWTTDSSRWSHAGKEGATSEGGAASIRNRYERTGRVCGDLVFSRHLFPLWRVLL